MRIRRFVVALQIALLALASTPPLKAEVRRKCHVYYATQDGWSQGYLMDVTFVTGMELQRKLNDYSIDMFAKFALIWFKQGEVAIIQLESDTIVGPTFSAFTFRNMFLIEDSVRGTQVNSENPREWLVAGKANFRYIDPNANTGY